MLKKTSMKAQNFKNTLKKKERRTALPCLPSTVHDGRLGMTQDVNFQMNG